MKLTEGTRRPAWRLRETGRTWSVLLMVLTLLPVAACSSRRVPATPPLAAPTMFAAIPPPTAAAPLLVLGPGDAVSLSVYGRPELSLTSYVADDGTLQVPLAGPVQVRGLSPAAGGRRIAEAFEKRQLLVDPQVTLFLVESRSQQVSVLGAVRAPGRYGVVSSSTIIDVLALAGGIAEEGGTQVIVVRADADGAIQRYPLDLAGLGGRGSALPSLTMQGGDSVFVPVAAQFSIYGEIATPNLYRLTPGMTVVEAISLSGGVTPRGSRNRVEIRRRMPDGGYRTTAASLEDRVEPDDVIRIKERLF